MSDHDATRGAHRSRARGDRPRHGAPDRGRRHQALPRTRRAGRGTAYVRPRRHRLVRSRGTRDHRPGRHAAARGRGRARGRAPAPAVRAAVLRRDSATIGGTVACGLAGPARAAFGPLARPRARRPGPHRRRPGAALRRRGHEERRRLRRRADHGGRARHARRAARRLAQGAALPARDAHAVARSRRARRRSRSSRASRAPPCRSPRAAGAAGSLTLRFEGTERTLDDVQRRVGGAPLEDGADFWQSIREHTHPFFAYAPPLWRLHVPAAAPALPLAGEPADRVERPAALVCARLDHRLRRRRGRGRPCDAVSSRTARRCGLRATGRAADAPACVR